jgi:DNA-binding GntR family transcriptional regulator
MTRARTGSGTHPTLAEWLAEQLRKEIRSGETSAGSHLRQNDVAQRFGVSSTPVREAFAVLERDGLVTRAPHRGVVVTSPTLDDLHGIYEIRILLEADATARATPNLTEADLSELERILDEMAPLTLEDDYERHYKLNQRFHDRIYIASGRPRLHALIRQLRAEPASTLGLFGRPRRHQDADLTRRQHDTILQACRQGQPAQAAAAMAEHLKTALDRILATSAAGR